MKYKINSIIGLIFFCLIALFSYNYLILNEKLAENQYNVLLNELNVVINDFNTWINEKDKPWKRPKLWWIISVTLRLPGPRRITGS